MSKGYARGNGRGGKRRAGFRGFKEIIVTVVFDRFYLCGMVSRDTGTFDSQSEMHFIVEIISIPITKFIGMIATKQKTRIIL
jgi:hypothetical protein